jgi:hypothetical protein
MSLNTPFAYIVSYDLNQSATKYNALFEELKRSHRWWHYLNSTWIVLRYEALAEFGPKLRPLIFQGDRLLIQPAKGPSDGWLPKEAWEWLQHNVPREW